VKRLALLIALIPAAAAAGIDNPEIPDEAMKRAALLLAYELNGSSMNGQLRMIDLSQPIEPYPKMDRLPLPEQKKKK